MTEPEPLIHVGGTEDGLYLGFDGRATQRVCPTAERLVREFIAAHPSAPKIILDLSGCGWVDSTFAGWLLGLRKRVADARGRVLLAGCAPRCRASLDKLQLGSLFEYCTPSPPEQTRSIACAGERPDRAAIELMARAHEELAALDERNHALFAPVAAMLRRQLQQR